MIQSYSNPIPINRKLLRRFFAKVYLHPDMWYANSQCWLWTGTRCGRKGYAHFLYQGKASRAHRIAYRLFVGAIPEETLDHLCRIRNCVNPAHLEPTSNTINVLRGNGPTAQNARKTHCPRGHAYTLENTVYRGKGRWCRTCERLRYR